MKTLAISHYIYLTKDQRYDLHNGKEIEVIGISVPVWFKKGTTSEPAKEIFCKYTLTNTKELLPIDIKEDGYKINLPNTIDINSESLLDLKDKGAEYLDFKQQDKMGSNNVIHFVEIKTVDLLLETLS